MVALLPTAARGADQGVVQEQCANAFEQAQRKRKAGALKHALTEAITCAQTQCSAILQVECARWIEELRAALPSVVIEVRGAEDRDVSEAQVYVDEQRLDPATRGRAFELDPGPHALRVDGQGQTIRQTFIAIEGRKNQSVVVRLLAPTATAAPDHKLPAPALSTPRKAALALATVTGLAVASGAYFGLRGVNRRGDFEQMCGGSCPSEGRKAIERDFLVADLSWVTAAVTAGGAAWLWWGTGSSSEAQGLSATHFVAAAAPGGACAVFSGSF